MRSVIFITLMTLILSIPMMTIADSAGVLDEAVVTMEISGMS